jgi:hypothetical protein
MNALWLRLSKELNRAWKKHMEYNNTLRWNGSGDLTENSVKFINFCASQDRAVTHIVYSRRPEFAKDLQGENIVLNFCVNEGRECPSPEVGKINRAFLRTAGNGTELVGNEDVIFPAKQDHDNIPVNEKDCPCDRGTIPSKNACAGCKRCISLS